MITKGIVFAGGLGTRLRPMTLAITKHLQAVYDKPMVYYPLATLLQLNIREILLIVHPEDLEPYQRLLGNGERFGVRLQYVSQTQLQSFAKNILLAQSFIANDPVCIIFADNFFHIDNFPTRLNAESGASVFTYAVDDPTHYGILICDERGCLESIEEKPKNPSSNFAVTGLYCFDDKLCLIAKENQDFSVTEINNVYIKGSRLADCVLQGKWCDMGEAGRLLEVSNFVKSAQKSGQLIGSPEWVAWQHHYIDQKMLESTLSLFKHSAYGKKMLEIYQSQ